MQNSMLNIGSLSWISLLWASTATIESSFLLCVYQSNKSRRLWKHLLWLTVFVRNLHCDYLYFYYPPLTFKDLWMLLDSTDKQMTDNPTPWCASHCHCLTWPNSNIYVFFCLKPIMKDGKQMYWKSLNKVHNQSENLFSMSSALLTAISPLI